MSGRIDIDDSAMTAELDRLCSLHRIAYEVEGVLSRQYQLTQRVVHVLTGSLKGSGDIDSAWDGDTWEGTLSYGGRSPGPNNPVVYAVYEQARGGAHDFMQPAYDLGRDYQRIVVDHLRGAL